jgi:C4-dicarboxylate-specific signal transduction histidine kinase
MDITAAKGAEQELQRARMELAHVTRVMTLGELSAAIAHEINQPLAAVVTDASAGLRWLGGEVPNLAEARQVLARIQKNGNRAADVIGRIRALAKKSPVRMDQLDINDVILDVIVLMRSEIDRNHIALRTALAKDLPRIPGDRVQLQQVMLNLIMNGIEAMSAGEPRSLVIASQSQGSRNVLVSVCDSGPGLDAASIDHIFDPFHTTKPGGMGMGLAISRSIIETHGGRLSARPNAPRGAMFEIELPGEQKHASAIRDPAQAAPAGVRDVTP